MRVTNTEKAKWEAAAEDAGLSVSAWLRRLANEDADFRRAQSWEKEQAEYPFEHEPHPRET